MKNKDSENGIEDLDFLTEFEEPIFHKDIMIQKLDKKKSLSLSTEITLRKKMLKNMFDLRFGKYFFKFKPESLLTLENQLKKYYFSPHSKFLYQFPRLRKKLLLSKRINYDILSTKINVGSLLYLSETEKNKTKKEFLNKKENIFAFSKNFATQTTKDVVGTQIYKYKFWDENSRRIKKYFSKRHEQKKEINESGSENEHEGEKKFKFLSKTSKNLDKIINDKIAKKKSSKTIEIIGLEGENIDYDLLSEDNNDLSQINFLNPSKTYNIEKDINGNSAKLKLNNINKATLNNNNMNTINESSLPSITVNSFNENEVNKSNKLELRLFPRNNEKSKTKTKLHKNSFFINSKKEFIESSSKHKRNLNKQVKELNTHTIKCNYKLYKLIDGNVIPKATEKLKQKNEEFDINNDLCDKNKDYEKEQKSSYFDYYEIEQMKKKMKDGINSLIKEAKNNNYEQDKFKKRELKLFPKKIVKMKDDYALQLVERLFSAHKINKEKPPEVRETIKEERERKEKKQIITLRKKAKFNHERIIKMGISLTKEKDRFFQKNQKITRK